MPLLMILRLYHLCDHRVTLFNVKNMREEKATIKHPNLWKRYITLWRDGFRNMTWGKPLWILNIIKLLILFGVLRLFFFPNFLKEKADTEEGRSEYVRQELINRAAD